jgi:hypothetical protein
MPTRLLHVGDARIRPADERSAGERPADERSAGERPADEQSAGERLADEQTGGLDAVRTTAASRDVDAVLFAGNLFSVAEPDPAAVESVEATLDEFAADDIRFCYVAGARDTAGDWNPWSDDALGGHHAVEHLDREPTDVGDDTAVYGLDDHTPSEFRAFLDDRDEQFTPAAGRSYFLLVLTQEIAPPAERSQADARAFEVATNVNLYLDAIAGGGRRDPAEWEHDDSGLGVHYPGSANPYWADEEPTGFLYETGDGTLRRETVRLHAGGESDSGPKQTASSSGESAVGGGDTEPTEPAEQTRPSHTSSDPRQHPEVTRLRDFLRAFETRPVESADTETLIDLYALLSKGAAQLDDRRKTVRDELEARTETGERLDGQFSTVSHAAYTRRSVRDEEVVLSTLDDAGIDPDTVVETVERIDEDALAEAAESHPDLSVEDVFEESTQRQIRREDVTLDWNERE